MSSSSLGDSTGSNIQHVFTSQARIRYIKTQQAPIEYSSTIRARSCAEAGRNNANVETCLLLNTWGMSTQRCHLFSMPFSLYEKLHATLPWWIKSIYGVLELNAIEHMSLLAQFSPSGSVIGTGHQSPRFILGPSASAPELPTLSSGSWSKKLATLLRW